MDEELAAVILVSSKETRADLIALTIPRKTIDDVVSTKETIHTQEDVDIIYAIVHEVLKEPFAYEFREGYHFSLYFDKFPLDMFDVRGRSYLKVFEKLRVVISRYSFQFINVSDDDRTAARGKNPRTLMSFEKCPVEPGAMSAAVLFDIVANVVEKHAAEQPLFARKLAGKKMKIILDGQQISPHSDIDLSRLTCSELFDGKHVTVVLVKPR